MIRGGKKLVLREVTISTTAEMRHNSMLLARSPKNSFISQGPGPRSNQILGFYTEKKKIQDEANMRQSWSLLENVFNTDFKQEG